MCYKRTVYKCFLRTYSISDSNKLGNNIRVSLYGSNFISIKLSRVIFNVYFALNAMKIIKCTLNAYLRVTISSILAFPISLFACIFVLKNPLCNITILSNISTNGYKDFTHFCNGIIYKNKYVSFLLAIFRDNNQDHKLFQTSNTARSLAILFK